MLFARNLKRLSAKKKFWKIRVWVRSMWALRRFKRSRKLGHISYIYYRKMIHTRLFWRLANRKRPRVSKVFNQLRVTVLNKKKIATAVVFNRAQFQKYFFFFDAYFLRRYCFFITTDFSKMIAFNTFSRKSKILRYFKNKLARIYKGHGWKTVHFKRAFVGYKLGEFTRTRQLALFRSKTLKKKMKMRKLSVYHNIKISKIKTLKASKLRKNRLLTKSGEVAL